ncbi:MAG: nucleotidyltransferase domain-containing protein [Archaeoglobaceae archaeon]
MKRLNFYRQLKFMEDLEKIDHILKMGGDRIKFIVLYGSVAEGSQRAESDVDLCFTMRVLKGRDLSSGKKFSVIFPANFFTEAFMTSD